jgi:hypothetical protein
MALMPGSDFSRGGAPDLARQELATRLLDGKRYLIGGGWFAAGVHVRRDSVLMFGHGVRIGPAAQADFAAPFSARMSGQCE